MNNPSLTNRYVWMNLALTLLLCAAAKALFHCWPEQAFDGYWLIPLFFLVSGRIAIVTLERFATQPPARRAQIYLLTRMVRLLVACVAVAVYAVLERETVVSFTVAFVVNYLCYLGFDTWFFSKYETKN